MDIPIGIRSFNRPLYTDVTLRSVIPTTPHENIVILDDCSNLDVTKKYLFTDEKIPKSMFDCDFDEIQDDNNWKNQLGELRTPDYITGISGKIKVVQPESKKGDLGGVYWCIDRLFKDNLEANGVILIEADMVFNATWYEETAECVEKCRNEKGPNGDTLGIFSCYNRKGNSKTRGWEWRCVEKCEVTGNWRCGDGLGGVMFYVTREFYESAIDDFKKSYPMKRSGDTALQGTCANHGFSIASTAYSCCQHIGYTSVTWGASRTGWRRCKNFQKPFILAEEV
jgi:hypothetical protein